MRSQTRLIALCLILPALAWAQDKVDLNTISKITVNGGAIEITGTKKPNFTTFTMTDPPRLVIDISEAVFSGVPDEMQVGNGTVTAIKTASYGSEASAIARVLVGFTREVETDIQTQGSRLVVKVQGGAPAVAAAETGNPAAPAGNQGAADQAAADQAAAKRAADTAAAQRAADDKAAQDAAARARADEEQARKQQEQATAEAARKAEEERKAQDQAAADAQRRAEADRQAQAQADREARAKAEADAKAEKQRQQDEARAAADEERQRKADEAKAAADAKKQQQEEARQAALEEKQRKAEEAKAAAEDRKQKQEEARQAALAEKQRKADEAKAAAEERKQKQEEARQAALAEKQRKADEAKAAAEERKHSREVAMAERSSERASAPEQGAQGGVAVSPRRKTMTFVGFKQEAGASRVYVRTNEPVRYSVQPGGDHSVVLELENTKIALHNNERTLDTSYFDTAIAMVQPEPGPTRTVRIQIKLKENVPYEAKQEGNEVYVDFQRPSRR